MALALRSPLAWPQGVAPGFDPRHVAATNTRFSGIPNGRMLFDLTSGRSTSVISGTITANQTPVGPAVNYQTTGTNFHEIVPTVAETWNNATQAVIFVPNSATANGQLCRTSTTGAVIALSVVALIPGGTGTSFTTIPLTQGVPYFMACSQQAKTTGTQNMVVVNLLTGQIQSATKNQTVAAGAQGAFYGFGPNSGSQMMAVMMAQFYTPMSDLLIWARDPWAFWYPSRGNNALTLPQKVAHGAAGAAISAAAVAATAGSVTASGNTAAHPTGAAVTATAGHVTVSSSSSITTIKPQAFSPQGMRRPFERPSSALLGINQAHPAAKLARLAAIAVGTDGTMLDLVSNKAGFWSLAAGANSPIGPVAFPATSVSGGIPFPPPVAGEVFHTCTIACIFSPRAPSHFGQGLVTFDQPGGNGQLTVQSNGSIGWGISGFGAINGLPNAIVGHNYFLVGSLYNTGGFPRTRGVLVDMTTGQIYVGDGGTTTFTTITAGANFTVLTYRVGGSCDQGVVAAAMISVTPLNAKQQLAWAMDPWSFWYRNEPANPVNFSGISRSTGFITGAKVTAVAGQVIIPKTVALTGAAVTTAAGALTKSITKALSGAAVTTSAGTLTVSAGIPGSVALVGAAVVTAPGSVSLSSTKALSGAAATTAAGVLGKSLTTSVTGAAVSAAAGSLASGPLLVVAGASVATAPGALTVSSTKALTGAAATVAAGALVKSSVLGIGGASVAVSSGQPSQLVSASVSGAASTVATGSVKGLTATGISGASIATAPGSVTESSTKTLIGAGTTTVAGQVSVSTTTSVNGASVGTAAGALAKSTSWPAPGVSVSTAAGSTTESITAKVTGVSITATANPLTSSIIQPVLVTISGASIAAFVGNVVVLAQTYINGINEGRSLGLDWQSANAALAVGVA